MRNDQAACALGLAGIGIGIAEIVAPRWLQRQLGLRHHAPLLRALGAREILSGIGILAGQQPAKTLWTRVAGDAMDLALIGLAFKESRKPERLAVATAMVAGISLLDLVFAERPWHEEDVNNIDRNESLAERFGLAESPSRW